MYLFRFQFLKYKVSAVFVGHASLIPAATAMTSRKEKKNTTVSRGYIEYIVRPNKRPPFPYFRGSATIKLSNSRIRLSFDDWKLLDEFVYMEVESTPVNDSPQCGMHTVTAVTYIPRKPDAYTAQRLFNCVLSDEQKANVELVTVCRAQIAAICNDDSKTVADLETFFRSNGDMRELDKRTTLFFYPQMQNVLQLYGEKSVVMGKLRRNDVLYINNIKESGRVDELLWPEYINLRDDLRVPKLPWDKFVDFHASHGARHGVNTARLALAHELYYDIIFEYAKKNGDTCVFLSALRSKLDKEVQGDHKKRTRFNNGGWKSTENDQHMPAQFEDAMDMLRRAPYHAVHTGTTETRGRYFVSTKNYHMSRVIADAFIALETRPVMRRGGLNENEFIQHARGIIEVDGVDGDPDIKIDDTQLNSIRALYRYPVIGVNGRPGCGKTSVFIKSCFLLKQYIDKRKGATPFPDSPSKEIKMLAVTSTGMAAYNVKKSTGGDCCTIDLHYMKTKFGRKENVDIVVVEEASACDDKRLYRLFTSVRKVRQIAFVFDNDQIPPVGDGFPSLTIFKYLKMLGEQDGRDLLHIYEHNYRFSGSAKCGMLKNCKAVLQQDEEMLEVSRNENGNAPLVLIGTKGGCVPRAAALWEKMMTGRPPREPQILAFENTTVDAVNTKCYDGYYKPKSEQYVNAGTTKPNGAKKMKSVVHFMRGMRVMFTRNFYARRDCVNTDEQMLEAENERRRQSGEPLLAQLPPGALKNGTSHDVMNGEIWNIGRIDEVQCTGMRRVVTPDVSETKLSYSHLIDYKLYNADNNTQWVFLGDFMPKEIKYACCITGHKSMGSQFPSVIICLEDHCSNNLSINLLYTEMSRAQKQVFIVTNMDKGGKYGQLSKIIAMNKKVHRESAFGLFLGTYGKLTEAT